MPKSQERKHADQRERADHDAQGGPVIASTMPCSRVCTGERSIAFAQAPVLPSSTMRAVAPSATRAGGEALAAWDPRFEEGSWTSRKVSISAAGTPAVTRATWPWVSRKGGNAAMAGDRMGTGIVGQRAPSAGSAELLKHHQQGTAPSRRGSGRRHGDRRRDRARWSGISWPSPMAPNPPGPQRNAGYRRSRTSILAR